MQSYLKKIRKTLNRQINFTHQVTAGKRITQNTKVSRREEIIISERKEMKETIVKINKTKSWFSENRNNIGKNHCPDSSRKKGEKSNEQN